MEWRARPVAGTIAANVEPSSQRALRKLVLVIDGALVLVAMLLASVTHSLLRPLLPWLQEPPSFDQYAVLPYVTLPLFLALIALTGLHRLFERLWSFGQLIFDLT